MLTDLSAFSPTSALKQWSPSPRTHILSADPEIVEIQGLWGAL